MLYCCAEVILMSRGNPAILVRLAPDVLAAIRELARKEGKSVSEIVRELLYERLAREK